MANLEKCPFCAETIQADAVICRYCNRQVGIPDQQAYARLKELAPDEHFVGPEATTTPTTDEESVDRSSKAISNPLPSPPDDEPTPMEPSFLTDEEVRTSLPTFSVSETASRSTIPTVGAGILTTHLPLSGAQTPTTVGEAKRSDGSNEFPAGSTEDVRRTFDDAAVDLPPIKVPVRHLVRDFFIVSGMRVGGGALTGLIAGVVHDYTQPEAKAITLEASVINGAIGGFAASIIAIVICGALGREPARVRAHRLKLAVFYVSAVGILISFLLNPSFTVPTGICNVTIEAFIGWLLGYRISLLIAKPREDWIPDEPGTEERVQEKTF